ncbi:MAG: hypothetical protein H0X65_19570 [Gemmatimonadetes bacterium]|nr:hypothetical protein [Gemmatimonadota bacterium]
MKAETFAKLVVLDTLLDAEVGYYLEHPSASDLFRERLVSGISDLVDQIDTLDAVAAAHSYDAIVDFLSELPERGGDGVVTAAIRFKRASERLVRRGMRRREMEQASTWAVVVDELLEALAAEYPRAVPSADEIRAREYLRAQLLLTRARNAAESMLGRLDGEGQPEFRSDLDRLTYAVRHQRPSPRAVELLIRAPQEYARSQRPTSISRVGGFVLRLLLRRSPTAGDSERSRGDRGAATGWRRRVEDPG